MGSIPSRGTYPGCGFDRGMYGRQTMNVSLSLSHLLKIDRIADERLQIEKEKGGWELCPKEQRTALWKKGQGWKTDAGLRAPPRTPCQGPCVHQGPRQLWREVRGHCVENHGNWGCQIFFIFLRKGKRSICFKRDPLTSVQSGLRSPTCSLPC